MFFLSNSTHFSVQHLLHLFSTVSSLILHSSTSNDSVMSQIKPLENRNRPLASRLGAKRPIQLVIIVTELCNRRCKKQYVTLAGECSSFGILVLTEKSLVVDFGTGFPGSCKGCTQSCTKNSEFATLSKGFNTRKLHKFCNFRQLRLGKSY